MKIISILITLIFFIHSTLSLAQEDVEVCLDCHSDKELTSEKKGIEHSIYLDIQIFKSSVHEMLSCTDCHSDVDSDDLPHNETLEKVSCSDCHDTEMFDVSVHGKGKVTCNECHGNHDIQFADFFKQNFSEQCIFCHSNAAKDFKKSIHSSVTINENQQITCTSCHGGTFIHSLKRSKFAEEDLHNICKNCHEQEVKKYEGSLHGTALTHGKFLAPNCITCHNAHQIKTSKDKTSKTYKMNIPELCGKCHKEGTEISELKSITHRSLLIERADKTDFRQEIIDQCGRCHMEVTDTYFDTFHGKATKLGSVKTDIYISLSII